MLLSPQPRCVSTLLRARGARWSAWTDRPRTELKITRIVRVFSGFTLGHSAHAPTSSAKLGGHLEQAGPVRPFAHVLFSSQLFMGVLQRRLRDRKIERQRRVEAQMPSTITVSLVLLPGNA